MKKVKLLHIMPHLGGGVGKALSTLVAGQSEMPYEHHFLLLEHPEKTQFVDLLYALGCLITVCPDRKESTRLIALADIVQLEWWNHPATFNFLCEHALPDMRLLIWCHVSGLHTPLIPNKLIGLADRFILTSSCSLKAESLLALEEMHHGKLGVVSSGVGLMNIPQCRRTEQKKSLAYGYIGSLNFSKLHPQLVDFLASVKLPDFQVSIWGDALNLEQLAEQCRQIGKSSLLNYVGYTTNVASALASLDIFVYLLNPLHYGTAENILLEAMSAGLVPVVLANPAEQAIVQHGENGLVVDSPEMFAEVIEWLYEFPDERIKLGQNAAKSIAQCYTQAIMADKMQQHYSGMMAIAKHPVDFKKALGTEPFEWYRLCQESVEGSKEVDFAKFGLHEDTKGSLQHFRRYFPDCQKLNALANL